MESGREPTQESGQESTPGVPQCQAWSGQESTQESYFCSLRLGARLVAKGRPDGSIDFSIFLRYAWLRVDQADPAQIRCNARNRNS